MRARRGMRSFVTLVEGLDVILVWRRGRDHLVEVHAPPIEASFDATFTTEPTVLLARCSQGEADLLVSEHRGVAEHGDTPR